ncbi:MAG: CPBP family intramembrane glutamic endopeptidase, partial [Phycisphaerae bacterium]
QDRVVAFIWLQSFLDEYLGLGSKFAWVMPPLTVVIVLIALQLVSRKRWYFGLNDVGPMTIECILLSVPLIVLSLLLSGPAESKGDVSRLAYSPTQIQIEADFGEQFGPEFTAEGLSRAVPSCPSVASDGLPLAAAETHSGRVGSKPLLANIVTGIGAGIYEELIFRLILMCLLMMLFQDIIRLDHKNSVILSVLISAALFSAHHHIVFVNGQFAATTPFNWPEFGFRTIAGVYFAVLFAVRGFGITAGTHAFYDIIATIINTVFFQQ